MEGKKVLWVVFSIALALVVILAAGLFLLRPRQPKGSEVPGTVAPATPSLQGYDPYEYVRGTSAPPGLTPPTGSQPQVIVVGEPPASQTAPAPTPPAAQQGSAGQEQVLPERAVAAPQAPPEQVPAERALQEKAPQERAPQERASASASAATSAKSAETPARPPQERVSTPPERASAAPKARAPQERASASATTPARASARPKAVSVTEYWIQAGSFSSAARADEVSRRLEERGLAPRTTTRDLNGKTHFRVRVGPYASRTEAEKFLDWIRELKGFETSYISMVASRRSMP